MNGWLRGKFSPAQNDRTAFTLIELLVVVAIIALLIAILLPALGRARAQSRTVVCRSNLKQIATSMIIYSADYAGGGMLHSFWINPAGFTSGWNYGPVSGGWLAPYYKDQRLTHCPEVSADLTSTNYGPAKVTATKIARLSMPTDTAMAADEVEFIGMTTRNPTLNYVSQAFNPPSTANFYAGGFTGRHNKMGNVSWYDGHVEGQTPWMNADYLSTLGLPSASSGIITSNYIGMLTPVSPSLSAADFAADPRKDYYFWSLKSSGQ